MEREAPIKVVYGIDRNYLVPAAVSMHSLCERTTAPLEIVVYGDGLEPSDHETLLKVGEAFGVAVEVRGYDPPPPPPASRTSAPVARYRHASAGTALAG